jgi:hypothetical protein
MSSTTAPAPAPVSTITTALAPTTAPAPAAAPAAAAPALASTPVATSKQLITYLPDGLIHFNDKVYDIRYKETDRERRRNVFKGMSGKGTELSDGEKQLLTDLGISSDPKTLPALATSHRLMELFEALPYCQSSFYLAESLKCITPRYLVNKVLEEAAYKQSIAYQADLDKKGASMDFLAKGYALLEGIRTTGPTPLPSDTKQLTLDQKRENTKAIYDFFELRI